MDRVRREFLKLAGAATLVAPAMLTRDAWSAMGPISAAGAGTIWTPYPKKMPHWVKRKNVIIVIVRPGPGSRF